MYAGVVTLSTRGLNLLLVWLLARFVQGVVTTSLRTFVERPEDPSVPLLLAQDAVALGLAAWFVWAVFELSRDAASAKLGVAARYGAIGTLVAALLAGSHGHVLLALDAPRSLFVPSPLVGELPVVVALVAWFGLLGLFARSGRDLGLRGLPALCTTSLVLLVLSRLGNLIDDALRMRRLYWTTHPDRHDHPEIESIVASAHDMPLRVLPAVANLVVLISFIAILIVVVRLRLQAARQPESS